jgi:hypothetical protein
VVRHGAVNGQGLEIYLPLCFTFTGYSVVYAVLVISTCCCALTGLVMVLGREREKEREKRGEKK